ncbi:hypothetical protein [Haladaptatus sp. T7]|uniref:hypothetical protein n=1 Tax=Haladaptatus sp. T7 TaxID=2029368 RepID=UPI002230F008|nr:hypothetical protein [Haladaptatus sp. T7]
MRRLPALLLVLLVLTSGCSGFLPWSDTGSGGGTPTATSTDSLSPPPGANGQWIVDAERLVSAHESALESKPYRVSVRIRPRQDVGSRNWMNSTLTAHVGGGRAGIREAGDGVVVNKMGNPYRGYTWNDSVAWCRLADDTCRVNSGESSNFIRQRIGSVAPRMETILSSADFLVNGTTVRNGTKLYRYEASGSSTLEGVETLSATALVDERGIIHDLSGTVRTTGTRSATVEFDYRYELVSNPPTPPKWMDDRPRLTVHRNASEVTVEHHGGKRIPAGTNASLFLGNDTVGASGKIKLPKSLGNGDVAHITVTSLEDTKGHSYRIAGNATVNRPQSNDSAINHTEWTSSVSLRMKKWWISIWGSAIRNDSTA